MSASVLIVDGDEFILFKNKDGLYSDCGGSVEKGETYEETASRELWEETCYTLYVPAEKIKKLSYFENGKHRVYILRYHFDRKQYKKNLLKYCHYIQNPDVFCETYDIIGYKPGMRHNVPLRYPEEIEFIYNSLFI